MSHAMFAEHDQALRGLLREEERELARIENCSVLEGKVWVPAPAIAIRQARIRALRAVLGLWSPEIAP